MTDSPVADRTTDKTADPLATPGVVLTTRQIMNLIPHRLPILMVDRIGLFAGIEECRFKRVVQPGDRLSLEVTMEKLGRRFGRGRGVASVDGEVCCEATISFIIPPEGVLG